MTTNLAGFLAALSIFCDRSLPAFICCAFFFRTHRSTGWCVSSLPTLEFLLTLTWSFSSSFQFDLGLGGSAFGQIMWTGLNDRLYGDAIAIATSWPKSPNSPHYVYATWDETNWIELKWSEEIWGQESHHSMQLTAKCQSQGNGYCCHCHAHFGPQVWQITIINFSAYPRWRYTIFGDLVTQLLLQRFYMIRLNK